jgi:hypothetical protein
MRIQQWTDTQGTVTLDGDETCGERTCDRIAILPAKDNDEFACARYSLWSTRDDRLLRRAELYDPEGRHMKTVNCEDYFASGRFMTRRSCGITHERTGTRSRIAVREVAYDTGLDASLFTIAHLSKAP